MRKKVIVRYLHALFIPPAPRTTSEQHSKAPASLVSVAAPSKQCFHPSLSRRYALHKCARTQKPQITAKMNLSLVLCRTMTPWLWQTASSWTSPSTAILGTTTIPRLWRRSRDCKGKTVLKRVIVRHRFLRDHLSCRCYGIITPWSTLEVHYMEIQALRILTIITHKKVSFRMNNKGFCFALIYQVQDSFLELQA